MRYNNINILFILVKDHEHVLYLKELLGDVIITNDDLSFKYQSDNIQEFTTILRKFNPQTFLSRTLMEYQTKLTQEEINILIFRYLKAGKYIKKRKLRDGGKIEYFSDQTHKMIEDTVKKFSINVCKCEQQFSFEAVRAHLIDYILKSINPRNKLGTRKNPYIIN
ncbi:11938_t:CDS:2 [Gigaspora rosea]|nr:11938_t:CDS:2 [Gigaspora rosea]